MIVSNLHNSENFPRALLAFSRVFSCLMGNCLLKEKNSFMSGKNKFLARDGEGRAGHSGEKKFIDVFHVSDHLEQFERLLFFFHFCVWKS